MVATVSATRPFEHRWPATAKGPVRAGLQERFPFQHVDAQSVRLRLNDVMEFMSKFTYTDNWPSECHERFCTLAWPDWTSIVRSAGFEIDLPSGPWRNEWMVENIFRRTRRTQGSGP
jgi:hypothetical protein